MVCERAQVDNYLCLCEVTLATHDAGPNGGLTTKVG